MKLLYLHHLALTSARANIVQVLQMCLAFERLGLQVQLAVPRAPGEGEGLGVIEQEIGERVHFALRTYPRYTVLGRLTTLGCYMGVRSVLASSGEIDVCFARNPLLARLAISRSLPTIFESHETRLHPSSRLLDRWYRRMVLEAAHSPYLVKFITISHALADVWRKLGVPPEKILVLHDGVAARQYERVTSRDQAKRRLGLDEEGKLVVYAGSLYADREVDSILSLAAAFPTTRFIVVGGPEDAKLAYEQKARTLGLKNLTFVGRVPHAQVKEYLFAADVLLMLWSWQVPTIHICSPLKVFEYMASGRIIVGYGFPTIEEVLQDGKTALLARAGSYVDLERKLAQALSLDYPSAIAEQARHLALTQYSWERRARRILDSLPVSA